MIHCYRENFCCCTTNFCSLSHDFCAIATPLKSTFFLGLSQTVAKKRRYLFLWHVLLFCCCANRQNKISRDVALAPFLLISCHLSRAITQVSWFSTAQEKKIRESLLASRHYRIWSIIISVIRKINAIMHWIMATPLSSLALLSSAKFCSGLLKY